MKNYTKTNVGTAARTELHDALSLTGAEVSINQLPAGAGVPFVPWDARYVGVRRTKQRL